MFTARGDSISHYQAAKCFTRSIAPRAIASLPISIIIKSDLAEVRRHLGVNNPISASDIPYQGEIPVEPVYWEQISIAARRTRL